MILQLKGHEHLMVQSACEKAALLGQTAAFENLYEELQRFFVLASELLSPDDERTEEYIIDTLHLIDIVQEASDLTGDKDQDAFNNMLRARAYLYENYLDFAKFQSDLDLDALASEFADSAEAELTSALEEVE